MLVLLVFVVGIWSLTIFMSRVLHDDLEQQLGRHQFQMATLMAQEIDQELNDRLHAVQTVANRISSSSTKSGPELQRFLAQSDLLQRLFNGGSFVVDAQGFAVASVPESLQRVGINYIEREHIVNALNLGKSTISGVEIGKVLKMPVVSIAAPIRNAQGVVSGAVVGVVNLGLENFLNTIVASPYGKTGGYLVVDKQHRRIITATDKSRVLQAAPPPGVNPRIDRYMQGLEGIDVFKNRLGVDVLQSNKALTAAPWFIAAQLPTNEAFAVVDALQRRTILVASLVTFLAVALVWWLLHHQFAPLKAAIGSLKQLNADKVFPPDLVVTRDDEVGQLIDAFNQMLLKLRLRDGELRESELRYRTLIEWTPEPLAVHDGETFVYVNPAAVELFGATSAQDLVGKSIYDVIHPDSQKIVQGRLNIHRQQAGTLPSREQKLLKIDGSTIIAEVRSARITFDGKDAIQIALHDITERKAAQDQVQQLVFSDPLTGLSNRRFLMERLRPYP